MLPPIFASSRLFLFLLALDQQFAEHVRQSGCSRCGGPLHVGNYLRKPRGEFSDHLREQLSLLLSFCCGRDGCRARTKPPSVRFLDRKVYVGVVVVIVTAMRQGLTAYGERKLEAVLGVDRRTVERWRVFWLEHFPKQPGWAKLRGHLPPDFREVDLPRSLLEHFGPNGSCRVASFSASDSPKPPDSAQSESSGRALDSVERSLVHVLVYIAAVNAANPDLIAISDAYAMSAEDARRASS
jgi:hypothetical protein